MINTVEKGITTPDKYGNKISAPTVYKEDEKALLALNGDVTAKNWQEYKAGKSGSEAGIRTCLY